MNSFHQIISRCGRLLALAILCSTHAVASDRYWTGADGLYSTPGNWQGGVPAGAGDTLYLQSLADDPYTITLDGDVILGTANTNRVYNSSGNDVSFQFRNGLNEYKLTSFAIHNNNGNLTFSGGETTVQTVLVVGTTAKSKLTLTGQGKLVLNSVNTWFRVGDGAAGELEIAGASTLTSSSQLMIGYGTASSKVTVKGASQLTVSAKGVYLGSNPVNTTATSGNELMVEEGSTVQLTGNNAGHLYIGNQDGASNNRVEIRGEDTTLTMEGILRIGSGNAATSYGNQLVIKDGATLTASYLFQIREGAGNVLHVDTGGTASFTLRTSTSASNLLNGQLNVTGGSFDAHALKIGATGVVTFTGGSMEFTNLTAATGSRFAFGLDEGELTIDISGRLTTEGTNYIDIVSMAGATPGTYTLMNFDSLTGDLTNFILGETPAGFAGTLSFDSRHLFLNVAAIPEPGASSLLLGGGAMAALLLLRRRKVS